MLKDKSPNNTRNHADSMTHLSLTQHIGFKLEGNSGCGIRILRQMHQYRTYVAAAAVAAYQRLSLR